jgi:hypothetical protein
MSEKLNQSKETGEKIDSKEVREHINELAEKLKEQAEKAPSKQEQESEAKEAAKSAEKLALTSKEHRPKSTHDKSEKEPINRGIKKQTYRATMNRVEAKLPAYQRTFSRFINNSAVDKISNVTSKTIARPSAILGSGLTAFIGLVIVTYYSNKVGFQLSGSEFIVLVLVGWVAGLLFEGIYKGLKKLIR